jgi:hypothetical protein
MPKVSTQLLVDPIVKEKVEALAIVQDRLQADVLRRLVEAALPEMEAEHVKDLDELYELLDGMKVNRERAMAAMLKAKLPIAALRGRKRFPLPLG